MSAYDSYKTIFKKRLSAKYAILIALARPKTLWYSNETYNGGSMRTDQIIGITRSNWRASKLTSYSLTIGRLTIKLFSRRG